MLPSPLPHARAGPLARAWGGCGGAALGYGIGGERACHRAGAAALGIPREAHQEFSSFFPYLRRLPCRPHGCGQPIDGFLPLILPAFPESIV